MNDPLYRMQTDDPNCREVFAEEAESLAVALYQGDERRIERKIRELHHAVS